MAGMADFLKSLEFTLRSGGGFNNIPDDPGGPTNHDISLRFLKGTGDYDLGDIDKDGDIDIEDIRSMTTERAAKIYKKYFWNHFPMDVFPPQVAFVLFDVAVNSGHRAAVRLLQEAVSCKPDGIIGPDTLYALKLREDSAYSVANMMLNRRRQQYLGYVAHNPKLKIFLDGWMNRVDAARKYLFEL